MKVLFTGSSSFTGMWFIERLAARGHQVVATLRGNPDRYELLRRRRVERIRPLCQLEFDCPFGSERFAELAGQGHDVLCHHAAEMRDYRSPDYDFLAATAGCTRDLRTVLEAFANGGGGAVVYSGTVFECDEGAGEQPRRAFSPYGLGKALTWQVTRYFAEERGLRLGKLVISNPFGGWENPRFTTYLIDCWSRGEVPQVRTPAYVRDNIPADLLARAYAAFVEGLGRGPGLERLGPCGYLETQGAFAQRFAREMAPRLGMACEVELANQTAFTEPRCRVNTDVVDTIALGFDEGVAWDDLADYYRARKEGREP